MLYFTADEHYGHANIIKYCARPFSSIQEMDAFIIARHNTKVGKNDTVYHLGDFCWTACGRYLHQLNGRHILIRGNHDKRHLHTHELALFERVEDVLIVKDNHRSLWLSHYAHAIWPSSHRGRYHVFGHSHGKFKGIGKSMDVGVDCRQFYPLSFNEIWDALSEDEV